MAHTSHVFVERAEAARAAGVPYQYVNGYFDRAGGKNSKFVVDSKVLPNGKTLKLICVHCVTDFCGTAAEAATIEDDSTVIATPFIGFRGWEISDDGTRLVSQTKFVWDPNGAQAVCKRHKTPPCPDPIASGRRARAGCGCGLYAADQPWSREIFGRVKGAVGLWGRFMEAHSGFRAQFGKPIALLCNGSVMADSIHRLCTIYRIAAVHNYDALEEVKTRADWEDPQDWGSDALAAAEAAERSHPGRAACRVAAARARDLDELKNLARGGLISSSITLADMIEKKY